MASNSKPVPSHAFDELEVEFQRYIAAHGWAPTTLAALLHGWESAAEKAALGYPNRYLDDYRYDLFCRGGLAEFGRSLAGVHLTAFDRLLRRIDERFRAATVEVPEFGSSPNWWESRLPKAPAKDLADDLREIGIEISSQ